MHKLLIKLLAVALMLIFITTLGQVHADDGVTACYTRTSAGVVFTFSPIPDSWLGDVGWFYIGDDVTLDGHKLIVTGLQFDEGYSYAIVGMNDYSETYSASTDLTPKCDEPKPAETPLPVLPTPALEIRSTGRVCAVDYPSLVLVCNGA